MLGIGALLFICLIRIPFLNLDLLIGQIEDVLFFIGPLCDREVDETSAKIPLLQETVTVD